MTASLPAEVQAVFDRFITTEFTTVDRLGQPITWPVTPYYSPGAPAIEVTTGVGYPKKARDARANPLVSLLFSDPTGSGMQAPPIVLVQGCAEVDDRDLEANRERYARESAAKLPATLKMRPPSALNRFFGWYYMRIYIRIRPERVYVWQETTEEEPAIYDAHMEEVRSGHSEEPAGFHATPEGGVSGWHPRIGELGERYRTAVLSIVSPDGFPFSVRVPVSIEHANRLVRIDGEPAGVPLQPGLACLTVHTHAENFSWQQNFQIRGDLVPRDDGWVLAPHRFIGGFEIPRSRLGGLRANAAKARRFHRNAKRELARRS